jgi:hypothetical protein
MSVIAFKRLCHLEWRRWFSQAEFKPFLDLTRIEGFLVRILRNSMKCTDKRGRPTHSFLLFLGSVWNSGYNPCER